MKDLHSLAVDHLIRTANEEDGWLSDLQGLVPIQQDGYVDFATVDGSIDVEHLVGDLVQILRTMISNFQDTLTEDDTAHEGLILATDIIDGQVP